MFMVFMQVNIQSSHGCVMGNGHLVLWVGGKGGCQVRTYMLGFLQWQIKVYSINRSPLLKKY